MKTTYEQLKYIIDESKSIVFFGGAGVSTESNIPDFRSETGLYKAKQAFGRTPEEMISRSFFLKDTETFFAYYKKHMIYPEAKPNPAHLALARLEEQGKLIGIVTQNIDGLHQDAGSRQIFELHGSVHRNTCMGCGNKYTLEEILNPDNCKGLVPICKKCGGIVKPDVVLYEEALDEEVVKAAIEAIAMADTLIVGGTSLVVYPAAGYINYFRGKKIVLINKQGLENKLKVTLEINEPIGKVLARII